MLNPAGIAVLVIYSSDISSVLMLVILVAIVLIMGVLDWLVFSNMQGLTKHLDPSRLAVTEAVFGVLMAALAVQLMLDGLDSLGIISLLGGH